MKVNTGLVRRALLSGDKRNRDDEEETSCRPDEETPLHKEYKRRMMSSLCNVPLERLNEEGNPLGLLSLSSSSIISETDDSNRENPFQHDMLRQMKVGNLDSDPIARNSLAKKVLRRVPSAPVRILDAPDIVDDYYLNLISWSRDNVLAVALGQSVYLWNATTGDIQHLLTLDGPTDYVSSVCWCKQEGRTNYIAVGTHNAAVKVFDGQTLQQIRNIGGLHRARVSSLAWNGSWLTSGSRDSLIANSDLRSSGEVVHRYRGHEQEVCGLKWNDDGTQLASGGNENFLCLWDASMSGGTGLNHFSPRLTLSSHKAAVKALDWCPFHRGLLASGGGTADRSIKFWNTVSGSLLNSIDTGSQVCSILWSRDQRELCSSHGYSENQLILWKYPSMTKIKELKGHTSRVLNMEMNPEGSQVVSAAADETLRFWDVFGGKEMKQGKVSGLFLGPSIR